MKKRSLLHLLFVLTLNICTAQTALNGSTWNFHFKRDVGANKEYYHLGAFTANTDTSIAGNTYLKIQSAAGTTIDYLREENGIVYYHHNSQDLRLFDFNKQINDSFLIDMKLNQQAANKDTVIMDVLVKIDSTSFLFNTTQTDSVKVFYYSVLSNNVLAVYPNLTIPFAVPSGITAQMLSLNMAMYNTISFTTLFNPNINLGPDSKPYLTCFENSNTGFSYKEQWFKNNQLPCNYNSSTGLNDYLKNALNIKVYPNPTSNNLQVTLAQKMKQIVIYDITGKLVVSSTDRDVKSIDISYLKAGIYYLVLISEGDNLYSSKFVKE
jgi:hypothetical protein